MLNNEKTFTVNMKTEVSFSVGSRHQLISTIKKNGWQNVGMVKDHGLDSVALVDDFINDIKNVCGNLSLCICDIQEPTYKFLDSKRIIFEQPKPDVMIGIGGGSAIDTAKAMALLVNNREPAITYRGFDQNKEPVLPIIAIPTTAGTGSEVTPNASFIDTTEKRKMGINGEAVRPLYAFLDPELTISCPEQPTLSAALDSIVHATEAVAAKKSNPWASMLALNGFAKVIHALPKVLANPSNIEARQEVMLGAFFSGVALMHSGTGPAAAMSYPLGVRHGIPHGIGGAIFLPHVIAYNAEAGFAGYAPLFDAWFPGNTVGDDVQKGLKLADEIIKRWQEWSVPSDVAQLGVSGDGVDDFISDTLELNGALIQNPVEFSERQIRAILQKLNVSV
jgi:alcohol dehydrogenase class IV